MRQAESGASVDKGKEERHGRASGGEVLNMVSLSPRRPTHSTFGSVAEIAGVTCSGAPAWTAHAKGNAGTDDLTAVKWTEGPTWMLLG